MSWQNITQIDKWWHEALFLLAPAPVHHRKSILILGKSPMAQDFWAYLGGFWRNPASPVGSCILPRNLDF